MTGQSTPRSLLGLSALLTSALVLIAVSAPVSANGSNLAQGGLKPSSKGMLLAGMDEMGGGKMTGDNKPGGMTGVRMGSGDAVEFEAARLRNAAMVSTIRKVR